MEHTFLTNDYLMRTVMGPEELSQYLIYVEDPTVKDVLLYYRNYAATKIILNI